MREEQKRQEKKKTKEILTQQLSQLDETELLGHLERSTMRGGDHLRVGAGLQQLRHERQIVCRDRVMKRCLSVPVVLALDTE